MLLALAVYLNKSYFSQENIDSILDNLGPLAALVYIAIYAIAPVLFIPGTAVTIIGGFIFGTTWGFIYSIIGATIGASLAFLTGRYLAHDWTEKSSGKMLQDIKKGIEQDGWKYIAFTRLVPMFPYSILNYAFGLTNIPLVTFAVTSCICLIPGTIVYSYIGSVGRDAAGGAQDLLFKISLAGLLIIIISFASKKFARKN